MLKTKSQRHVRVPTRPGRGLLEFVQRIQSPLKVDRDKGVIFGVKVLGRYSKNTHDERGVTGSEYSPRARKKACQLYEGMTVRTNHPADRRNPGAPRDVYETFGKLVNCREEGDDVRADLHYLKAHPLANAVCEDVERGLGVYGLSHNASASEERVENGRLVIEDLAFVRSVDLVDKPATNRNLWESARPSGAGGPAPGRSKSLQEQATMLRRKDQARDLCESLGFVPTRDQLSDLAAIADPARRKRVAEACKKAARPGQPAKGPGRGRTGRDVVESKSAGANMGLLRGQRFGPVGRDVSESKLVGGVRVAKTEMDFLRGER